MTTVRTFRLLAIVNAVFGALLMLGAVFMVFSLVSEPPGRKAVVVMQAALVAFGEIVAVILLSCAIAHLKRPSQKSALNLAATSGVLVWILSLAVANAPALGARLDLRHSLGLGLRYVLPIALAALVHRCYLVPSALRLFRADQKDAPPPAGLPD